MSAMRIPRWGARAALAVLACSIISAQERPSLGDGVITTPVRLTKPREQGPPPSLRMDVNRVFVPVTVTDQNDQRLEGLERTDFRILADGVEQPISEFFLDESPVSIGVVLDASNSMKEKFDLSRRALSSLLRLCPPEDAFFLVTVQDRPTLVRSLTPDPEEIEAAMQPVITRGWTALYDGMYLAMNHLRRSVNSQRVLVVLSDGGDNNSRYTESEIRSLMRETDVRIFSISVQGRSSAMERFSEESGGRAFQAHKLDELQDLAVKVNTLIHGEYVLAFSPRNEPRDGKYHNVRIQLTQPGDPAARPRITWRHGYYAPLQ
jgi:Ca-activated chloride channel family protein